MADHKVSKKMSILKVFFRHFSRSGCSTKILPYWYIWQIRNLTKFEVQVPSDCLWLRPDERIGKVKLRSTVTPHSFVVR